MAADDLQALAGETDLQSSCPVKVVEQEQLEPFGPFFSVLPVLAAAPDPDIRAGPRAWSYRVC